MQKRRFHQSMIRQFGQTDFFNRIGSSLTLSTAARVDQFECKRVGLTNAIDWSVVMQRIGQAFAHMGDFDDRIR
jgi:hypothetical protein